MIRDIMIDAITPLIENPPHFKTEAAAVTSFVELRRMAARHMAEVVVAKMLEVYPPSAQAEKWFRDRDGAVVSGGTARREDEGEDARDRKGNKTMLHPSTFEYLKPTIAQIEKMARLREAAKVYADILDAELPEGADKTFVLRAHRSNAMWVNMAVTRTADCGRLAASRLTYPQPSQQGEMGLWWRWTVIRLSASAISLCERRGYRHLLPKLGCARVGNWKR